MHGNKPTLLCSITNGRKTGYDVDVIVGIGCYYFEISHLIMLNYFCIYSNLALTYVSDMLQIFDTDYATLIPCSRSFKYIFFQTGS